MTDAVEGPFDPGLPDLQPVPAGGADTWFSERMFGSLSYGLRVVGHLHSEQSAYQRIDVLETAHHGRLLVLDGCVMLTERDEFPYHELLAHVPARTLESPRRALVVGGGDGGTVRELLRYPELSIVLAEIDERVVRVSQEYLPSVSAGLEDPRVTLALRDGAEVLAEQGPASQDLIVVDSTDPVGPATALISQDFYARCARALAPGGVFVAQTQSPFTHGDDIRRIYATLCEAFPRVWMYWGVCPSYLGFLWTFCYASHARHPLDDLQEGPFPGTRYYSPGVHRGAFALPPFVGTLLPAGHPQRPA